MVITVQVTIVDTVDGAGDKRVMRCEVGGLRRLEESDIEAMRRMLEDFSEKIALDELYDEEDEGVAH